MTGGPPVLLALLLLEDADLGAAGLGQRQAAHHRAVERRAADADAAVAADHEDPRELDLLAGGCHAPLDLDRVARRHPILLAAGLDDRVHAQLADVSDLRLVDRAR